jgi:hypothetical protein
MNTKMAYGIGPEGIQALRGLVGRKRGTTINIIIFNGNIINQRVEGGGQILRNVGKMQTKADKAHSLAGHLTIRRISPMATDAAASPAREMTSKAVRKRRRSLK